MSHGLGAFENSGLEVDSLVFPGHGDNFNFHEPFPVIAKGYKNIIFFILFLVVKSIDEIAQ